MKDKSRRYEGDGFVVTFTPRRCIHASACIHGLPGVFDRDRRPWIDPTQGDAASIGEVVRRCPTGALKMLGADGEADEPIPDANVIRISQDGPAYVSGDVEVTDHDGKVLFHDTRMALCRCGRSSNKPLCDDSHYPEFSEPGALGSTREAAAVASGRLTITLRRNGPLRYEGPLEIISHDGTQRVRAAKGALCRCGGSKNMPFCDSSHKTNGFTTESGAE